MGARYSAYPPLLATPKANANKAGDGEEILSFHIDHALGGQSDTSKYSCPDLVKTDNIFNCTKPGRLRLPTSEDGKTLSHDDRFGIAFSPGTGIVIHKDLHDMLSDRVKSPIIPCAPHQKTFYMPTETNPTRYIDILGETLFPFALREWHNWGYYIHFRVKVLVTIAEIPLVEPNFSSHDRALAWSGIRLADSEFEGSLVQAMYRIGGKGSKPMYRVKVEEGPTAGKTQTV